MSTPNALGTETAAVELPRDRLVQRALEATHSRLVLVSAPWGAGKSWLLRQLAQRSERAVVRIRLDHRSTDYSFFFWQLLAALGLHEGDLEEERETPAERIAGLLRALAERPSAILALDGAEVLAGSPAVLELVGRLANRFPLGGTLVVSSRTPLAIPAHDLAADEIVRLGPEEFALSDEEAAQLVRSLAPTRDIRTHHLQLVREHAEGQCLAFWLFGLAARTTEPDALVAALVADERPLRPLVAGALEGLAEADREGLETLSVLDELEAEAANALIGNANVRASLIERAAGLHLIEAFEQPPTLPSAVLAELRARVAADPPRLRALHARAATTLREEDPERAFHHFVEAGDIDHAVEILVTVGHAILHFKRIDRIEALLEELPPEVVDAQPALRFVRGTVAVIRLDIERARPDLEHAAKGAENAGLDEIAHAARARLALTDLVRGHFESAAHHAQCVVERTRDCTDPVVLQAATVLDFALEYLGRSEEAAQARACMDAGSAGYPALATERGTAAFRARLRGDRAEQRRIALEAIEGGRRARAPGVFCFMALHAAEPEIAVGRPEDALEIGSEAVMASRSMGETWFELIAEGLRLYALRELGRFDEARRLGRDLTRRCRESGALDWTEAEAWLQLARIPGADRRADLGAAGRAADAATHPSLRARVALEWARLALDEADATEVERHLAEAERALGTVDARPERYELGLLQARAQLLAGRKKAALARLSEVSALPFEPIRDRRGLLPLLVPMALDGDAWAEAQVEACGSDALGAVARHRSARARRLRDRMLDYSAAPIDVALLGAAKVTRNGRTIALGRPRVSQLFFLLLLSGLEGRPVSSDHLLDALWPDQHLDRARHSMNTHLSTLRRVLEPYLPKRESSRYLLRDGEGYRLDLRGGHTDLERFEQLAAAAFAAEGRQDLRAAETAVLGASSLYRGPLLEEFAGVESFLAARDRATATRLELSLCGGRVARRMGDTLLARERFQLALRDDPCSEGAHRALIGLYAETGREDLAAEAWRHCRRAYRIELDARPTPALDALSRRLKLA